MIAVIKYKAGNLASVANALNRLEAPFFLASTPQELESSRAVIFPGVGHAGAAMDSLKELELDQWLRETTKPVLGICVGMQLLFEGSDEGNTEGLGVIPGRLKRFDDSQAKVPHMGWNTFNELNDHPLLKNISEKDFMYFVHSYYAAPNEYTIAKSNYINDFAAVVAKDNFMGVQFHPEKSGYAGSHIMQNYLDYVYSNTVSQFNKSTG